MTTQTKWTADASNVSPGQIHLWVETETGEKASPENWDMDGPRYARLCEAAPELADFVRAYLETASSPSGLGKIVEDDGVSGHAEIADIDAKARALLARLGAV